MLPQAIRRMFGTMALLALFFSVVLVPHPQSAKADVGLPIDPLFSFGTEINKGWIRDKFFPQAADEAHLTTVRYNSIKWSDVEPTAPIKNYTGGYDHS